MLTQELKRFIKCQLDRFFVKKECVVCKSLETKPYLAEPYHDQGSWGDLSTFADLINLPTIVDQTVEPAGTPTKTAQYKFNLSQVPATAVVKSIKACVGYYGIEDNNPGDNAEVTLALTLFDGTTTTGLAGSTSDTAFDYWGDYVPGIPYDPSWHVGTGGPSAQPNNLAGGLFGTLDEQASGQVDREICINATSKMDGSPILGSDLANLILPIWHQTNSMKWGLTKVNLCVEWEDSTVEFDNTSTLSECTMSRLLAAIEQKSCPASGGTTTIIGAKEVIVDKTVDATFSFAPVDIHNNGATVLLKDKILDAGWSRAANVITYTGTPDKVKGYLSLNAEDDGASNYWSRPQLNVLRGGNIIAVIDDIVMQDNGAYDGDATLNGVFFDKNPGANPSYTFEWFDDDNRTATLVPNIFSQLALEATTKVQVYAPV